MAEDAPFLPGLSPFAGKPVHVDFEGGRLTSDGGALLLAEIERKLGVADRLVSRTRARPSAPGTASPAYPARAGAQDLVLASRAVRLAFVKIAARVTELVTRI